MRNYGYIIAAVAIGVLLASSLVLPAIHAQSRIDEKEAAAEARLKAIEHRLEKLTSDFAMPDEWASPNGDRT